jgi:hypothetical protein
VHHKFLRLSVRKEECDSGAYSKLEIDHHFRLHTYIVIYFIIPADNLPDLSPVVHLVPSVEHSCPDLRLVLQYYEDLVEMLVHMHRKEVR